MSATASFRQALLDLNRQIQLTTDPKTKAVLQGRRDGLLNDRLIERHNGKVSRRLAEALCERSVAS